MDEILTEFDQTESYSAKLSCGAVRFGSYHGCKWMHLEVKWLIL